MYKRNCGSLMFLLLAAGPLTAALTQPVHTDKGMMSGEPGTDGSVVAFKGIPYATPPVGDLRWRAPKPASPWQGVKKADRFSASCIQNIVPERKPWTYEFMTHGEISEDCLYLNVWTPAKTAKDKLPVFFWIHGGGNSEGSGAVPVYDGEALAKKGIVFVSVNYRVGLLGFFTYPELTTESDVRSSGNYGLLDQLAALQWVHDNIASFGGDPNRVTVGGQSAGAADTHQLTASPLAGGLFIRAIAETGSSVGGGLMPPHKLADEEQDGVKFAEAKGAHSLADLRALSWQQLLAPLANQPKPFRFGIVVDGYFLPASVTEIFAAGKQNDVATLTGSNKDDLGITPHPEITARAYEGQAQKRYRDMADRFLALYPASSDAQAALSLNEGARDQARVSTYLWAMNRAKTAKTSVYTYFFDHALPGPDVDKFGAFHTAEVPYVLDTLAKSDRPFTDADRKIAETLSSYWVNFVKTGNPNGRGLPHWSSVVEKPAMTMEIGDKFEPIPVAGSKEKLTFFEQYFAHPHPPQMP